MRGFVCGLALASVVVPEEAVDAQNVIAIADLVVSGPAGRTSREAAALSVPVYATSGGLLGGVDEVEKRDAWRDSQIRYLVHFSDGGNSGMRYRSEPLTVGAEITDGGTVYRVERVEPPPNSNAFGHAWVTRLAGS